MQIALHLLSVFNPRHGSICKDAMALGNCLRMCSAHLWSIESLVPFPTNNFFKGVCKFLFTTCLLLPSIIMHCPLSPPHHGNHFSRDLICTIRSIVQLIDFSVTIFIPSQSKCLPSKPGALYNRFSSFSPLRKKVPEDQ
ncbi:unnamed protein product, partial [Ixodes pacificus]